MSEDDTLAVHTAEPAGPALSEDGHSTRRLTVVFWIVGIALAALHNCAARHMMNPDGINYIDMGEAYLRGDWDMAINSYWSPFYSWLVATGLRIMQPSPYWEFAAVHLVNFLIYIAAMCCFHFFLAQVIHYNQFRKLADGEYTVLPDWAWIMLGYPLFMWTSLRLMVSPSQDVVPVTPDMCVAAFVYLAAGLVLKVRMDGKRWAPFVWLGIVLGFGYLAKAPMLPLGIVFLGVAFLAVHNIKRAIPRALVAFALLLLIAGPHITLISRQKGKFTFGESKTLTYAWFVNGVRRPVHWQGGPPGSGTPVHPTRQIFDSPEVFGFGTPIGGTYPAWYDPTYWYEGLKPHFSLRGHLSCLTLSAKTYFDIFARMHCSLIVAFLVLCFVGCRRRLWVKDIAANWVLLLPAIAALGMYSLIFVRGRYIGAFIVIIWAGLLSSVRLVDSSASRRLVTGVCGAVLVVIAIALAFPAALWAGRVVRDIPKIRYKSDHVHWRIANALHEMGVEEGDKVAFIGWSFNAYWARVARVRIVAEIPVDGVLPFLAADAATKAKVMEALAGIGAKAVLTDRMPEPLTPQGWTRIGDTNRCCYLLPGEDKSASRARSPKE